MQAIEIVNALRNKKGQHVQAVWQREVDMRKKLPFGHKANKLEKRTCAWVRSGINYANLASVKEGIATGERNEVQPLPDWEEWVQAPYILRNKKNSTEYVRLYPATFPNLQADRKVEWILDGVVVDYETAKPFMLAKDYHNTGDEPPTCFAVKAADILTIAGE